jgi:ubiquinone/menaquinone biosynthesis C-methylase UbiE
MKSQAQNLGYAISQGLRVSNFLTQTLIGNRILGRKPTPEQRAELPPLKIVLSDLYELFERDLRNIRAGLYKAPREEILSSPFTFASRTARIFGDLLNVRRRKNSRQVQEVPTDSHTQKLPHYYRQNFHFQTDGYLSEFSADVYDHQVELVFVGGGEAMRRQALLPLRAALEEKGLRDEDVSLLDVGGGTGRFMRAVKDNHPGMHVTGLDLSPYYLKKARAELASHSRVDFVEAPAEDMPFRNAQFDVVSCIYLFHELPRLVRKKVAAEMLRVLKPGGTLILLDSIQLGDKPDFDGSVRFFPVQYHEPYYLDYVKQDLDQLFPRAKRVSQDLAFFSKVLRYEKASAKPRISGRRKPASPAKA